MDTEQLPRTDVWTDYDWSVVLGEPSEFAAKNGDAGEMTPERIKRVAWLWAESPEGYGSVDMACLAELVDGTYAMCEAWADTTGWDCRSGVTWKVGASMEAVTQELSESNRDRYRGQVA